MIPAHNMPPAAGGIKAFILHLNRAEARAAHVKHLCGILRQQTMFCAAEIIPAQDALLLTEEQITACYRRKIFLPFYPFALKAAEIACFLSHRKAWQALLDQGCDAAFIAEDDMQPNTYFAEALILAYQNIQDCGFIRFPHKKREKGSVYKQSSSGRIKLIRPNRIGLGAVAYMLSRQAAAALLKITERFDRPVDVLLQMFWLTKIRPFSAQPGGICENSAALGGSTLAQKQSLRQKAQRELLRPFYRGQISLLSCIKS